MSNVFESREMENKYISLEKDLNESSSDEESREVSTHFSNEKDFTDSDISEVVFS